MKIPWQLSGFLPFTCIYISQLLHILHEIKVGPASTVDHLQTGTQTDSDKYLLIFPS